MFRSCRLPLALGLSLAVTGCGLVEVKTSAGSSTPSSRASSGHVAKASGNGSAGSSSTAGSDGAGASPQKSADYNTVTARFPELTDADAIDLAKARARRNNSRLPFSRPLRRGGPRARPSTTVFSPRPRESPPPTKEFGRLLDHRPRSFLAACRTAAG
jgi:hypothetical protein